MSDRTARLLIIFVYTPCIIYISLLLPGLAQHAFIAIIIFVICLIAAGRSIFVFYQSPDKFLLFIQKLEDFLVVMWRKYLVFIWRYIRKYLMGVQYWTTNPSDSSPNPTANNSEQEANPAPAANPAPDSSALIEVLSSLFEMSGYFTNGIGTSHNAIVQKMIDKMDLEKNQRQQAEYLFRQGKRATSGTIQTLTSRLKSNYHGTPEILNIFIIVLMEFIYSLDATIINSMNDVIRKIATQFDLQQITIDSMVELTRVQSQDIKKLDLKENVYKLIGISNPTVNKNVVKKTARSLKKTYHPDALRHKGLPKELEAFGTQLSQTYNSIYENHIKKLQ